MNLKLLKINRDYIESNINYKKNLKRKIYKKINYQTGGAPLNLDKIQSLTESLKKLKDTSTLVDKKKELNTQIDKINNYIEKNLDSKIDFQDIELEKIINNANMLVITEEDAQKMNEKNLKIQISVDKELKQFQDKNLDSIKSIKEILDKSLSLYSSIKSYNFTRDEQQFKSKLLEIKKELDEETKKNETFYKQIDELDNFNSFDNFDKSSLDSEIKVEFTNPIYYYTNFYNKVNKEEFKLKFEIENEIPKDIEYLFTNDEKKSSDDEIKLSDKDIINFNKYKDKFNIFEIKKYLNSIFPNLLLQESDILEDRIDNKLLDSDNIIYRDETGVKEDEEIKLELSELFKLPKQVGGNLINELTCIIKQTNTEILKLEEFKKNLVTKVNKYNFEMNKLAYHNIFMIGVFNKLFKEGTFVSINYINSGLILFYKNIVDKILEEINKNSDKNLLLYFKKYHFLNLEIIKKILDASLGKLKGKNKSDIINIRASGQNVRYAFLILNFLNTNLDNYFLESNTNVTIYARINDWGEISKKLFTIDENNFKILNVNEEICGSIEAHKPLSKRDQSILNKTYNFTYVFGDDFDNSVISTYMGLDTLLSQKKSLAMITYGYSGTGKTFTLFGNEQKSGMLQNIISRIKGLTQVYIRIFEIYGRGFQYPFYWNEETKYQTIYDYKIGTDIATNKLKLNQGDFDIYGDKDFKSFMEKEFTKYVKIDGNNINKVLESLKDLVKDIDNVRKYNNRIRETPNNIESSRSIIVYDFTFIIDDKIDNPVYFLIMDLPGRENIEKTYIDNYVKVAEKIITNVFIQTKLRSEIRYFTEIKYYPLYIKMLLFATSMQPLLIPIIDPIGFLEAINTIDQIVNKDIITKVKQLHFNNANKPDTNPPRKYITDDIFDISDSNPIKITLKKRYDTSGSPHYMQLMTRKEGTVNENFIIANWGIFYMNIIITLNNFEILETIIKHIIKKRFNDYIEEYSKSGIINYQELLKICKNNYHDYIQKNEPLNFSKITFIKNKVLYDYFMTPYEGLYINENIVGIIKYCEKINSKKSSVNSQDPNLNFDLQKTICRGLLLNPKEKSSNLDKLHLEYDETDKIYKITTGAYNLTLSEREKYNIHPLLISENNVYNFNFDNIKIMYNQLKGYYDPSCIYNDGENHDGKIKEILIANILTPYIGTDKPRIKDFKIFYLFSNTSLEIKCYAQANLLELTKDFISTIVPVN